MSTLSSPYPPRQSSAAPQTLTSRSPLHGSISVSLLAASTAAAPVDGSRKEWNVATFEWRVGNVRALRDSLDAPVAKVGIPLALEDASEMVPQHELFRDGAYMAGGMFKLDFVCQVANSLTLYLSPLAPLPLVPSAAQHLDILIGITLPTEPFQVGRRHGRREWVWQQHEPAWAFCEDVEFFECTLPPLDALLERAKIAETDAFLLCVQISSPAGFDSPPPQRPGLQLVPRDLLDGLASLLDSPTTADVRFLCFEHEPLLPTPSLPSSRRTSSSSTVSSLCKTSTRSRPRMLYAHSTILSHRSSYFSNLLLAGFHETSQPNPIATIIIDDADFSTVYWMLHYLYANELDFAPDDDVRALVATQAVDRGATSRILTLDPIEWGWTVLPLISDQRSDGQSEYGSSSVGSLRTLSVVTTPVRKRPAPPPARRAVPVQAQTSTPNKQPTTKSPIAPPSPIKRKDPHPHPTPAPAPTSALSMYMLSHRYGIQALQDKAAEHMLFTLDVDKFTFRFATFHYETLYKGVQDFVVDNWQAVQASAEFLNSIQQVSAGLWGDDGGLVLHGLFRRL